MPPTFYASILKTLAITSSFSSLITSKRTLIGQILAKFSYPQLNQALLAGYLLYNLSEVEKRFGQGKFIKFLAIQFLITRINFHNFLQIQHLDLLIFSLIPIHYNLNWLPRQNIFNLLVVLGKFFSGNY